MRSLVLLVLMAITLIFGSSIISQEAVCDNNVVVFSSSEDNRIRYKYLNVDSLVVEDLPHIDLIDDSPQWSPDKSQVAFASWNVQGFEIYSMDHNGNNLRQLADGLGVPRPLIWSPDNTWIAFPSNYQVFVANLTNGEVRQITNGKASPSSWSVDAKAMIISEFDPELSMSLSMVDINTGEIQQLTEPQDHIFDYFVTWTPDGNILFNSNRSSDSLTLHHLDMTTLNVIPYIEHHVSHLQWTSDKSSFVFTSFDDIGHPNVTLQNIFITDWMTGTTTQITEDWTLNHENFPSLALSPDDNRIVFESFVDPYYQLFIIDVDGDNLRQLTFDEGHHTVSHWLDCYRN